MNAGEHPPTTADSRTPELELGEREVRAWRTVRRRIEDELDSLRSQVHSPHVKRTARLVERELEALERKLAG